MKFVLILWTRVLTIRRHAQMLPGAILSGTLTKVVSKTQLFVILGARPHASKLKWHWVTLAPAFPLPLPFFKGCWNSALGGGGARLTVCLGSVLLLSPVTKTRGLEQAQKVCDADMSAQLFKNSI